MEECEITQMYKEYFGEPKQHSGKCEGYVIDELDESGKEVEVPMDICSHCLYKL